MQRPNRLSTTRCSKTPTTICKALFFYFCPFSFSLFLSPPLLIVRGGRRSCTSYPKIKLFFLCMKLRPTSSPSVSCFSLSRVVLFEDTHLLLYYASSRTISSQRLYLKGPRVWRYAIFCRLIKDSTKWHEENRAIWHVQDGTEFATRRTSLRKTKRFGYLLIHAFITWLRSGYDGVTKKKQLAIGDRRIERFS